MKTLLSILLIGSFLFASSQNDFMPFSTKAFLKKDPDWTQQFSAPATSYSKTDAIINNAEIIKTYYKPVKGATSMRIYNKRLKILTEGFADVLSNYKFASPIIAMGKEYLYQKAEEAVEAKVAVEKSKFRDNIKSAFDASIARELKANPNVSFDEAVTNFSEQLEQFSEALNPEDYEILAPIVDQQSLKYIKENRDFFETKFKAQKDDVDALVSKSQEELSMAFDAKMQNFEHSVKAFDKKLLEGIKENAESLAKFNAEVERKFKQLDQDVKDMRSDIMENEVQIASNKKQIEANKGNIALISKLQAKNADLISDNAFKIGVITDVLYDNADINGKLKILDLKYKGDTSNEAYKSAKNTLENIQTIQTFQNYLNNAGDFVELGQNLGLSDKDAQNANKAIALGNVLINGTMAFYGNPMAGIQAINGAFALFGGGGGGDPQFDAIMAEFAKINAKLDEMNEKLDGINENILELRQLNVDLFIENQKRFTKIDEKLITIENKLDRITQLFYSSKVEGLRIENVSTYKTTYDRVRNATTLGQLRTIYQQSNEFKTIVKIVYDNTVFQSSMSKPYLHFNSFDSENTWENDIYLPMLRMIREVFPKINMNDLEHSIVNLKANMAIPRLNTLYEEENVFKQNLPDALDVLIYPQSLLTLTEFASLVEPYLYFYDSDHGDNFNIPETISINPVLKNENTKIKFEHILLENRKAIAQTNIISGAVLLPYFKKHIVEKGFNASHKSTIYKLLQSDNVYLKLNLANYIINTELTLETQIAQLYDVLNQADYDKALQAVNTINKDFNFENTYFKLSLVGKAQNFRPVLTLKPRNIDGIDASKQELHLPLPFFEHILEQKVLYPEYLQGLLENENVLINKIAKYDIINKVGRIEKYKNYIHLN